MDDKVSKRDWESISAYLDGQLSTKKLARFETRISQEPHLRVVLIELQKTRQVLRHTPRLRSPRNFLLTAQMVGQTQRMPRLAPVFGWASAVASLLFVVVMAGDLFNSGGTLPVALNKQPVSLSQEIAGEGSAPQDDPGAIALDVAVAGGFSEATEAEIPQGEVALEAAAVPEMEVAPAVIEPEPVAVTTSTPVDESRPQSEIAAAAEAPVAEGNSVNTTARSAPPEELMGASAAITPTLTATFPVQEGGQHIEITATEAVLNDELDMASAPDLTVTEPVAEKAFQPPEADAAEVEQFKAAAPDSEPGTDAAASAAEANPETDFSSAVSEEQALDQVSVEKTSQIMLGIEAILLLLALATGIAWVYLRYRGG